MPRWTPAALALAAVVAVRAQPLPQTQSTASILGRVVDASSGQPVAGAIVKLEPAGKQAPMLTGADGQFVFRPLSPGLYRITASKPGYLDSAYGQMRARGQGTMLLLRENARRDDAVIRMWPWGTITGRVMDEHGRPVVGVVVGAWRLRPNGHSEIVPARDVIPPLASIPPMLTDSEGRYAIRRLTPGRYVVGSVCGTYGNASLGREPAAIRAAGEYSVPGRLQPILTDRGGTAFTATSCHAQWTPPGERARLYEPAFYGDSASPATAATIQVAPGDVVSGIDLTLRSRVTSRVAGRIIGPSLGSGGMLRLVPSGWNTTTQFQRQADSPLHQVNVLPDGTFVFVAVTPGSYILTGISTTAPAAERYWVNESIAVDDDIDDLVLTARRGVSIAGQIHAAGTPPGPLSFEVGFGSVRNLQASASGAFVITDVMPGKYLLAPKSRSGDWQIVSATLAGRDVLGATLDVETRDISGLTIHFSDQESSVVGNVTDSRGPASAEASVVLFSTDTALWSSAQDGSPLFRIARTWSGHYVFERIPVGEYVLAAVDDAALEEWPDVTLLSRIATVGHRVRIAIGQQIERDLRVEIGIK
jgi:protocatechuate 3,4-dioxygenase beta subunit